MHLLSIPTEIRLYIYDYLLDDGGNKWLAIRNKPALQTIGDGSSHHDLAVRKRTRYHVMERVSLCHQRCHETTYHLANMNSAVKLHTAILAVCRLLYHEAAEKLYGEHCFDFSHHIEAVVPFLQDRTQYTRSLVTSISVYKRGPFPSWGYLSAKSEWSYMCNYLSSSHCLKRLCLTVEGGQPGQKWEGVRQLSESDIRLLSMINHDTLDWVKDLIKIKGLEDLRIVPDFKYIPVAESSAMIVYAALSASLEEGLLDFLRSEMGIRCCEDMISGKAV